MEKTDPTARGIVGSEIIRILCDEEYRTDKKHWQEILESDRKAILDNVSIFF